MVANSGIRGTGLKSWQMDQGMFVYSGIDGEIGNQFDDMVHQAILGKDTFVGEMKERITGRLEREAQNGDPSWSSGEVWKIGR